VAAAHDAPIAGVDPRAIRVRTGVFLLILADAMFVASILAGNLYLGALNVMGQFKPASEQAPSAALGIGLTLIAVASALSYGWATRAFATGNEAGFSARARLALGLVAIAVLGQIWFIASLSFPAPLHGYASMIILLAAYHELHLLVTAVAGLLILGRLARRRLVGQGYLVEVVGYWWYYVAVVAVVIWLVGLITPGVG
jgi:heme/copper-type cytochrome/quinol oxidase subunit 3